VTGGQWLPDDAPADVLAAAGGVPAVVDVEVADVDTLIERADLGPGSATFVAAGDPFPAGLAGLPRRPR
jgi:hypothetical protein